MVGQHRCQGRQCGGGREHRRVDVERGQSLEDCDDEQLEISHPQHWVMCSVRVELVGANSVKLELRASVGCSKKSIKCEIGNMARTTLLAHHTVQLH